MVHLTRELALLLITLLGFNYIIFVPQGRASDIDEPVGGLRKHVRGGINIRLRDELWNTFERQGADTDRTYNFFLARTRGFIDAFWNNFTFHVMGQAVGALNLPENGGFGAGTSYFSASDMDEDRFDLHLMEAYLQIKDLPVQGFYLRGGRIGIMEGAEVFYGGTKIDWVIKNRLSERLIGNWDWTNLGRRFDGGIIGYSNSIFDINAFGANVLEGGFDFDDGYEELDHVIVVGGAFTLKKDVVITDTQLRVFDYFYFDNRDPAKTFAGDELEINTIGASVVGAYDAGPGQVDLLLWFAFQTGNFGDLDQKAFGFIGEIGYQFLEVLFKPWLRLGIAYASGDDDPDDSDNGTFFNMVPTNHKWYGYVDAVAFSNLIDVYSQLMLALHNKVSFAIDGHIFRLASDDESWIAGSGPFNNQAFGYTFFQPVAGEQIDRDLGEELDFTLAINLTNYLSFGIGYSHFFGGDGIDAVFDKEDQLDWFYAQTEIVF